jgi:hypothetical protein
VQQAGSEGGLDFFTGPILEGRDLAGGPAPLPAVTPQGFRVDSVQFDFVVQTEDQDRTHEGLDVFQSEIGQGFLRALDRVRATEESRVHEVEGLRAQANVPIVVSRERNAKGRRPLNRGRSEKFTGLETRESGVRDDGVERIALQAICQFKRCTNRDHLPVQPMKLQIVGQKKSEPLISVRQQKAILAHVRMKISRDPLLGRS